MNRTEELKPCPFCGGNRISVGQSIAAGLSWWEVFCETCTGRTSTSSEAEAIAVWNTRATQPDAALRECQAVWRCAIGDATGALDVLKNRWFGSRRKGKREAGAVLAGVLDLVWAARDPAPGSYSEANTNGKALITRVRAALDTGAGRG